MFRALWDFDPQLVPITIALVIFYLPTAIRRRRHIEYVPLYFTAYPLADLNEDLYDLYTQRMLAESGTPTDEAQAISRERIKNRSYISALLDGLAIPLVVGVILASFMDGTLFRDFLVLFSLAKLIELTRAAYNFTQESLGSKGVGRVVFVYVVYFAVALQSLRLGHAWARPFFKEGDYVGLIDAASSTLIIQFLVSIVLLPIAVRVLGARLLENE